MSEHEIVYLGPGALPADRQIRLDDLLVRVRGDRVVLRSRHFKREVVPRLASGEISPHTLGVYRFLAALQSQGTDRVKWSWGPLADLSWLPRVLVGGVVLAREQWLLGEADLRELATVWREGKGIDRRTRAFAAMQVLRARRGLPRYLVLADGDREQFVDLDHQLLVHAFVGELVALRSARLVEVFPRAEAWPVEGPTGRHACQVILTFVREANARSAEPRFMSATRRHITTDRSTERRFLPGSGWLYARLYGGSASADRVLCRAVAPLVRTAAVADSIDRWFFTRQADPAPHLRVQLAADPKHLCGEVLPTLERLLRPLLEDGSLWRVDLGTYEREVDQYGGDQGIELCEDLFWYDSEAALRILAGLDADNRAEARWQLALSSADRLLSLLGFSSDRRSELFTGARVRLESEFGVTTAFYKAVGVRYRSLQARLERLLARELVETDVPHREAHVIPGLAQLRWRDLRIQPLALRLQQLSAAGSLDSPLPSIAMRLVHMSCNRLLNDSRRAEELVIYDLLRRYHARARALARSEPPGQERMA